MQRILDRVKRLLAVANHANSNPHEAENAARRAQTLITKHGIEQAQLRDEQKKGEPIIKREIFKCNRVQKYKLWLVGGIAATNNCEYYYTPGFSVTVYGHQSNVDMVEALYDLMLTQVNHWGHKEGKGRGKRYSNSYKLGMVMRIGERLKDARNQAQEDLKDPTKVAKAAIENGENLNEAMNNFSLEKTKHAIAIYNDQSKTVTLWGKVNLKLRTSRAKPRYVDQQGYNSGKARGNSVSLGSNKSIH